MGYGYGFTCINCGHVYDVHLGIGMMFPSVYQSCIENIKEGKYGKKWKTLVQCQEYIAVDAEKYLYICKSCGNWKVDKSLSLYEPKEPNKIADKKYGTKTVRELGYVPYVTERALKTDYLFLKSYIHKCDKCGKRMHRVDTEQLSYLQCPKCGTKNEKETEICWD